MEEFIDIISRLGFPIACCVALYVQQNKYMREFTDKMSQSIQTLVEATNHNTTATNTLVTTVTLMFRRDDNV